MKILCAKFLLLAAAAFALAACNNDKNQRPGSFIRCGDRTTTITGAVSMNTVDECMFGFYGEGLTVDGIVSVRGTGDVVHLQLRSTPGTYVVSGDSETYPYGDYLRNFTSEKLKSRSEEEGELQAGTIIAWSKNGDVVTIDIEGTYLCDAEGARPERFKLHYVGEPVKYAL